LATLACLIGWHHYGEDHGVGAGILRRVCRVCRAVTIDLRGADELSDSLVQTRHAITSPGSDR
jgi:hypothetical protein